MVTRNGFPDWAVSDTRDIVRPSGEIKKSN